MCTTMTAGGVGPDGGAQRRRGRPPSCAGRSRRTRTTRRRATAAAAVAKNVLAGTMTSRPSTPMRAQDDLERARAGAHRDGVLGADVGGEALLELAADRARASAGRWRGTRRSAGGSRRGLRAGSRPEPAGHASSSCTPAPTGRGMGTGLLPPHAPAEGLSVGTRYSNGRRRQGSPPCLLLGGAGSTEGDRAARPARCGRASSTPTSSRPSTTRRSPPVRPRARTGTPASSACAAHGVECDPAPRPPAPATATRRRGRRRPRSGHHGAHAAGHGRLGQGQRPGPLGHVVHGQGQVVGHEGAHERGHGEVGDRVERRQRPASRAPIPRPPRAGQRPPVMVLLHEQDQPSRRHHVLLRELIPDS